LVNVETVEAAVIRIVAVAKRIPAEQVTLDSTFDELGIDSLDAVNLLFDVESEFNIEIPDEQARSIRSVRLMAEGIRKLLARAPSSESKAG
jgi:acyl carrier protein